MSQRTCTISKEADMADKVHRLGVLASSILWNRWSYSAGWRRALSVLPLLPCLVSCFVYSASNQHHHQPPLLHQDRWNLLERGKWAHTFGKRKRQGVFNHVIVFRYENIFSATAINMKLSLREISIFFFTTLLNSRPQSLFSLSLSLALIHTHTHTPIHPPTHPHPHTHTYTYTHTHIHTHTHTHTYIHTHTHTHHTD